MKQTLLLSFLGIITILNAQIPNGFSYQAVVRNSDQTLLKNRSVTVKATIIRNDEPVFEQTQTATTNENGLLTIIIGNESFQDIDWLQGTLFIKTQIDPAGGSNFTIETQTQLLTVPYSMAAKTAETAVTVQGLENLIERVNNLENQIEELWTYTYEEGALNSTHWKAAGIVNSETGNFYEFEPKDCESCYKLSFGECTFSGPVDNIIGGFGYGNILCGFYDINYITKNIYINIWTATLVGQHFDEELYIETLNSVYYFSLRGSKLLLYFDEHKYLLLNLLVL